MSDLNSYCFTGRVAQDLELKTLSTGTKLVKFTVSVVERWQDKEKVYWITLVAWGKLAEICAQYLKKGDRLAGQAKYSESAFEQYGKTIRKPEFVLQNVTFLQPLPPGDHKKESSEDPLDFPI